MTTTTWTAAFLALGLSLPACGGSNDSGLSRAAAQEGGTASGGASTASGGGASDASASGGSNTAGSAGGTTSGTGGATGGAAGGTASGGAGGNPTHDGGAGAPDGGPDAQGGGGGCGNTYYADTDGDRYGDPLVSVEACSQPAGYVTNADDCYDQSPMAKPAQTGWFAEHRGDGSFDYDCDGSGTNRWTVPGTCPVGICNPFTEGWQGAIPSCGAEGAYIVNCIGLALCAPTTEARKQECH